MKKGETDGRLSASLEILVADSAAAVLRAQQRELKRLIALEAEATYEAPTIACWRLRGYLRDGLRPLLEWIGHRCPTFRSAIGDTILDWIYSSKWFLGWTLKQERDWAWQDTLKLLNQSQLATALIEGRLVAVIGYKLGGKMADGREVFEITKSSTLPGYRNLGLNRRLRCAIMMVVAERHGTAPVISFTRNPSVIRRCQALGWRALSLDEYAEILGRIGRRGPPAEFMDDFKRHWRAFLHDPQATGAPGGLGP